MPSFLGRACAKCMRMIKLEKKCPSPRGRAQGLRVSVSLCATYFCLWSLGLPYGAWHSWLAPPACSFLYICFPWPLLSPPLSLYPRICCLLASLGLQGSVSSVLIFSSPSIYPGFYISVVHTWFCLPPAWLPMAWPVMSPHTSLVKLETTRLLWPLLLSSCSVLNERFQPHSIVPAPGLDCANFLHNLTSVF